MIIQIANKIRLKNPPMELQERLIDSLKISNPKYGEAVQAGRSTWDINPFIYNFEILPDDSIRIPRGYRANLLNMIDEMGIKAEIVDNRKRFDPFFGLNASRIKYRPYQYDAVSKLITAEEGVLVAPAGSGKTVIGISLTPLFGQPTLWLTHTGPLADQAIDRIRFFFPDLKDDDVGLLGRGKWKIGNVFTVGMIQTLVRRLDQLYKLKEKFGLVILDEAHHCPASTFLKVIGCFAPYYMYGLTATPYRRDKLQQLMFQVLGNEIVRISIDEVEKHGGMMRPKVRYKAFHHYKSVQGSNIPRIFRDHIIDNDKRNHFIVSDVLTEAAKGNICIVTSDRKAHCETLHGLISIAWDNTGIATGDYSKTYVAGQIARLNSGEITVLVCTNQLLGEGFDYPPLNRAFIATPFRSEVKCEQLIGRIQRPAPGKKDAIVFDYVDIGIGVLQNQFYSKNNDCRYKVYKRLGVEIEPF